MRIADDVAAPVPHCRVRYERGEPMAAVSGEPNQIDWSVRTRWLFVDHGVALTAIGLPARFALRRRDRTVLNPAAIFPIQFCRRGRRMPFKSQAQRRKFAQLL